MNMSELHSGLRLYARLGEVVLPGEVMAVGLASCLVRLGDIGVLRIYSHNLYLDEGDAITAKWKDI